MNSMPDFESYISPLTWRYGSQEMRSLWSEVHKRRLWRQVWVALAEVQAEFGLLSSEQMQDLRQHANEVDVEAALAIEAEIHHDLVAELKVFAGQAALGGGALHLGATSADIEDNADVLRMRDSLDLVLERMSRLLVSLAERIETWADYPVMGYTHLQPAEPTTLGYRLAQYAQDLLMDWEDLRRARRNLRGKGFKGAVGTGAAFAELLGVERLPEFETRLSIRLGLPFYPVTTQTYPRKQDWRVTSALAGLGGSLYRFAFDLRVLQSPGFGELAEPFGRQQVGSSAMPFKRNPVSAEKIDSLGRALAQLPRLAWDNAAHSLLERTLDDSANRRVLLPEAFLLADELLLVAERLVEGLQVDEAAAAANLEAYGLFSATERVLAELTRAGADRQVVHERLRTHAMQAWEDVRAGQSNPLVELVSRDEFFLEYLGADQLRQLMDVQGHLGNAPDRARELAGTVRQAVSFKDNPTTTAPPESR
jgi:adenylosuccinate lyase